MTPELLERISGTLRGDLRPVRPLPSRGRMVAMLVVAFAAGAASGGAVLGFIGWHRLPVGAIATIFPPLAGLALLAAAATVSAMIPGSKRPFHPAVLLGVGLAAMAGGVAAGVREFRVGGVVAPRG